MCAMNSSVTRASATSVMYSWCFEISPSSRSNGPSNTSRCTWNGTERPRPVTGAASSTTTTFSSGGVAAGDELASQLPVGLGTCVGGRVGGDRLRGDRGVGELHGPRDDRAEDVVAERLDDARDDLTAVQRAAVVHRGQDAVDLEARV